MATFSTDFRERLNLSMIGNGLISRAQTPARIRSEVGIGLGDPETFRKCVAFALMTMTPGKWRAPGSTSAFMTCDRSRFNEFSPDFGEKVVATFQFSPGFNFHPETFSPETSRYPCSLERPKIQSLMSQNSKRPICSPVEARRSPQRHRPRRAPSLPRRLPA